MPKPTISPLFLLSFIVMISCSDKRKSDEKVIQALETNLWSSSRSINISTESFLKILEDRTFDWKTRERALVWYPKAINIKQGVKKLYDRIEVLKLQTRIEDLDFKKLQSSLQEFKSDIFRVDSSLHHEFENKLIFINRFNTLLTSDSLKPVSLKKDIPEKSVKAILSLLQNDLKIFENLTIIYCNNMSGSMWDGFEVYSPLVSQNGKILNPNDILEINAGIGFFSRQGNPTIIINGSKLFPGWEGFSTYKMKVSKNPGNYSIPIQISYMNNLTGKPESWNSNIQYSVADTCRQ